MNRVTPLRVSIGSKVTVQIGKPELSMVLSSHMKMSRLRIVAEKEARTQMKKKQILMDLPRRIRSLDLKEM